MVAFQLTLDRFGEGYSLQDGQMRESWSPGVDLLHSLAKRVFAFQWFFNSRYKVLVQD